MDDEHRGAKTGPLAGLVAILAAFLLCCITPIGLIMNRGNEGPVASDVKPTEKEPAKVAEEPKEPKQYWASDLYEAGEVIAANKGKSGRIPIYKSDEIYADAGDENKAKEFEEKRWILYLREGQKVKIVEARRGFTCKVEILEGAPKGTVGVMHEANLGYAQRLAKAQERDAGR